MSERLRPTLSEAQIFEDVGEAEMEMGALPDPLPIRDSTDPNGGDGSGFVVLPTKIPLGAIIVFVVQCIVTAISITSIYVEQKTNTMTQNDKIARLEANSYTTIEARYLGKEINELKEKQASGK